MTRVIWFRVTRLLTPADEFGRLNREVAKSANAVFCGNRAMVIVNKNVWRVARITLAKSDDLGRCRLSS